MCESIGAGIVTQNCGAEASAAYCSGVSGHAMRSDVATEEDQPQRSFAAMEENAAAIGRPFHPRSQGLDRLGPRESPQSHWSTTRSVIRFTKVNALVFIKEIELLRHSLQGSYSAAVLE
jgi:hypothetical protein